MPTWTPEQLRAYENRRSTSRAQPQRAVQNEPVAAAEREERDSRRILVSIKSYRRRLLDPDNLTGGTKYFVDSCRYAGLIPGDRPDQITLSVQQFQVKDRIDERTEIEITDCAPD